jgi:hypothetical protein
VQQRRSIRELPQQLRLKPGWVQASTLQRLQVQGSVQA